MRIATPLRMALPTRRASTLHPAHPSLVNVAFALLALGVALDALSTGRGGAVTWLAFWVLGAGVAFGTWSAIFSLFDWVFFARPDGGSVEAIDGSLAGVGGFATALIVGLFGLAALTRVDTAAHAPPPVAIVLEMAGATLMWMRSWMGRELVREPRDP